MPTSGNSADSTLRATNAKAGNSSKPTSGKTSETSAQNDYAKVVGSDKDSFKPKNNNSSNSNDSKSLEPNNSKNLKKLDSILKDTGLKWDGLEKFLEPIISIMIEIYESDPNSPILTFINTYASKIHKGVNQAKLDEEAIENLIALYDEGIIDDNELLDLNPNASGKSLIFNLTLWWNEYEDIKFILQTFDFLSDEQNIKKYLLNDILLKSNYNIDLSKKINKKQLITLRNQIIFDVDAEKAANIKYTAAEISEAWELKETLNDLHDRKDTTKYSDKVDDLISNMKNIIKSKDDIDALIKTLEQLKKSIK